MAQAIVHRSRTKLRSAIEGKKSMLCWNFASDLREMMKVLEVIEPAVEDAERYSLCDEASREWLQRVRMAAYGISDMVDELQDTSPRPMPGIFIGPRKNPMSNRIKEMKLELRMLQESHRFASQKPLSPLPHQDFIWPWTPEHQNLTESSTQMSRAHGRGTDRRADELDIVGRGENKQAIIDTLSDIDFTKGSAILPIFGLAAIGKTTLAKLVFKDTGFGEYKLRIWVDVTPKFDLADIGNHIISEILEHLETENQRGHGPYRGSQVSNKGIINTDANAYTDTDTDTDTDIDGSSQESEERISQVTHRTLQKVQEITEGSDGASPVSEDEIDKLFDEACQVSEDEINNFFDEACQVSEDEINRSSDGPCQVSEDAINKSSDEACQVSEDEINKSSDGACHISEDEISKSSDEACQESEDEINRSSDGPCQVSEDAINKSSDEACQVSEDEINKSSDGACHISEDEISKSSDGVCQESEDEINRSSDGPCQVSEDAINKSSDEACQVSEDEINKGSDGACHISEHEISKSSDGVCQESEDEINRSSDGPCQVSEDAINKSSDEACQVSEDEINKSSDGACHISEHEISKSSDGVCQESEDEINRSSDGPCQVSEDAINKSSDEACQVSEDEINKSSDGACHISEHEISKSSDGVCQESEDEINRSSDGPCQVSEDAINKSSDEACQVSEDEINKSSDGACHISEHEISKSSDGVCQESEDEINRSSDGPCQVSEDAINKSSDEACQVSEDEINKSSDGACHISEHEISKSSDGVCQESEDEINKGSDGTSRVLAEEINKGACEISEVLEDREINCGIDVISQVSEEEIIQCSNKISLITKHLHELLNGMKTLIVLDDLWEEDSDKLKRLKHLLGVGIKGSKVTVIVTTCNEGIARKVFTVKPYKLDPLTDDMCWVIIKKNSDFVNRTNSVKQELERIGLQIASKCGGLPLAAQELGRSLRSQDTTSWAEAMKRDIWSNIRSNSDVIRSLELSYRSMPQDLRLCFAYCAIFAQGDKIIKDDIIRQWIALGLVGPSVSLSITQVANEYIRRLLDISFLQTAKSSASTSGNGDMGAILLIMHETAHALARSLGDELIVLDGTMGTSDQINCCRYALLSDFGEKLSSKLPTQLRALRCVGCSKKTLVDDAFSFTGCLRVLHLNDCSIQKLPDSICQLRQLGYLNLSGCSRLITLPESFGGLLNLQYINLSRCYGLAELPESFQKLRKLLHLDLSFWCCFEGIPVLGGLTSLQYLNLSRPCCYRPQHRPHVEGLKNVLCKLTNLQYLNLSMCMNPIFCYWSEEQCCEYIRSCTSGLSNLKHLDLSHNIFLVGLPESLGELQKLHTLDLTGCIRLKSVAKRICESDSLEQIVIWDCRGLESWSFVVRTDDGGFSSDLVHLEHLIVNCQDLEITCLENVKSTEEAHRIRLLGKRKLKKLTLCWTAGSQRSVEDDANLLAELEPPYGLQHLELHDYRGTCHPAWVSSIYSYLPNLKEVTMEDFPMCTNLPPFALLPKLQRLVLRRMASITIIDVGELCGGNTAAAVLHRLSNFTIDGMESLIEFNTTYYGGSGEKVCMFPAVDELVIQKCSKLRFRSLPPRTRRLVISDCPQVLSPIDVSDCDQVIALQRTTAAGVAPVAELVIHGCIADWSLLRYLAGLERLSISHCEGMTSLPQHMGHLNSLHDLQIVCCKQLKRFPDSMQHLTSLHSLHFGECGSIKKLAKWFGYLTSLQKLSIHKCHAFESLPRSIKRLENLNELHIVDCETLADWCEENPEKLGLIKPKYGLEDQARLEKKRQEVKHNKWKKKKEKEKASRPRYIATSP